MDKASLLADAVVYINELKGKVEQLESKLMLSKTLRPNSDVRSMAGLSATSTATTAKLESQISSATVEQRSSTRQFSSYAGAMEVDVKIIGKEAMIRVQCPDVDYPSARLMNALRDLEFRIIHVSISSVKELMLQDVVVRVPDRFSSEEAMRIALMRAIMQIS